MFQAKEKVLDRIGQSYSLFRKNFYWIFMPIFIYNIIFVVLIFTFIMHLIFSSILAWDSLSLLSSANFIISIAVWIIIFIVYLILYIWVFLWTIKWIKQATQEEKINIKENIFYGFSKIFSSFKIYWYIFVYVAMIPALLFIVWWLTFIAWANELWPVSLIEKTWVVLMWLWTTLFIVLAIYRWIRAAFAIYNSVEENSFTKKDFWLSINITENNWWRIAWNFLLTWLITVLIAWIVLWTFSLFIWWIDYEWIDSLDAFTALASQFSLTTELLKWFINNLVSTTISVYMIVFTYIFYLRLKDENKTNDTNEIKL